MRMASLELEYCARIFIRTKLYSYLKSFDSLKSRVVILCNETRRSYDMEDRRLSGRDLSLTRSIIHNDISSDKTAGRGFMMQ